MNKTEKNPAAIPDNMIPPIEKYNKDLIYILIKIPHAAVFFNIYCDFQCHLWKTNPEKPILNFAKSCGSGTMLFLGTQQEFARLKKAAK